MKYQKDTDVSALEPERKPKTSKKKEKRKAQREGEGKDVDADIEGSVMSKKGAIPHVKFKDIFFLLLLIRN